MLQVYSLGVTFGRQKKDGRPNQTVRGEDVPLALLLYTQRGGEKVLLSRPSMQRQRTKRRREELTISPWRREVTISP